jgi:hypothetical protein
VVFRPDGTSHEVDRSGKVTVAVFGGFFDLCSPPLAIGEGSWTYTDSGSFGNRVSLFVHTFRAQVTDQSGERHHILIRYHFHFDPSTGEERELVNDFEFK